MEGVSHNLGNTYDLVMGIAELLAHEFGGPLVDALTAFTLYTGDDERHVVEWFGGYRSCSGVEEGT